ncbi:caspase family protein [Agromyces binzhouensis]|uniref:caspase family protein n=1 Tax=Agromyces binzhouensis TaxID=1817495 RepID=UPI0036311CB4
MTMRNIAVRDGFTARTLLTSQATAANVLAEVRSAARQSARGDVFLITYAGHGAQVPNVSDDDEIDDQDETWVTYERMLIDDELELAFSEFAAGVDIVLLSDSCHSGTVYRRMFTPEQLEFSERKSAFYGGLAAPIGDGARSFPTPAPVGGSRGAEAAGQREIFTTAASTFLAELKVGAGWTANGPYVSIFDRFERLRAARGARSVVTSRRFPTTGAGLGAGGRGPTAPVLTRNMPLGVNAEVVARHASLYLELQAAARGRVDVRANGVSISGCQDSQLSQEVGGHGVFTTTLERVWNSSSFSGTYRQFHQAIVGRMGPTQTPELGLWGADPDSLAAKTPFG